jgi:hypothetical protein
VVDGLGRAIPGALVSVVWGTAATPEIGRRTDALGAFHVGLPPGRFRLEAVAEQGVGQVEVEGGEGDEIVIVVERP